MVAIIVLRWLSLLVDVSVKSLALLTAAAAACLLLRRASAASRHLVWRLAMISLLCLPLLSAVLPGWQVRAWPRVLPPLPAFAPGDSSVAHPRRPLDGSAKARKDRTEDAKTFLSRKREASESAKWTRNIGHAAGLNPSIPTGFRVFAPFALSRQRTFALSPSFAFSPSFALPIPPTVPSLIAYALLIWLSGAVVMLLHVLVGIVRLRQLERWCRRLGDGPLAAMFGDLRRRLGLRRAVTLMTGAPDGPTMAPMTWGCVSPVVLLPPESDRWPADRLRAVLLHELAHVQRQDWLAQILTSLTCALYWFQPLVLLAARQMRLESERACDDRVLAAGMKPSDYAGHLLAIARSLRGREGSLQTALTMAWKSPIERRLQAILERRHSRGAVPLWVSRVAAVVAAGAVVPLAVVRPVEEPALGRGAQRAVPSSAAGGVASVHPPGWRAHPALLAAVEINESSAIAGALILASRSPVEITEHVKAAGFRRPVTRPQTHSQAAAAGHPIVHGRPWAGPPAPQAVGELPDTLARSEPHPVPQHESGDAILVGFSPLAATSADVGQADFSPADDSSQASILLAASGGRDVLPAPSDAEAPADEPGIPGDAQLQDAASDPRSDAPAFSVSGQDELAEALVVWDRERRRWRRALRTWSRELARQDEQEVSWNSEQAQAPQPAISKEERAGAAQDASPVADEAPVPQEAVTLEGKAGRSEPVVGGSEPSGLPQERESWERVFEYWQQQIESWERERGQRERSETCPSSV